MRVSWLWQAVFDLQRIEELISKDNPSVASEVVMKIIRTVSLLGKRQGIGSASRVPGTKELAIPDFPYIVPYRVKDGVVQVLRVYGTSRDSRSLRALQDDHPQDSAHSERSPAHKDHP